MTIGLNNFGEFTDRCISGVLERIKSWGSETWRSSIRIILAHRRWRIHTGRFIYLSIVPRFHERCLDSGVSSLFDMVVTGGLFLRVGIQCLNHGRCISNGSFGNIENQLH